MQMAVNATFPECNLFRLEKLNCALPVDRARGAIERTDAPKDAAVYDGGLRELWIAILQGSNSSGCATSPTTKAPHPPTNTC
jgi:hypothetical protein